MEHYTLLAKEKVWPVLLSIGGFASISLVLNLLNITWQSFQVIVWVTMYSLVFSLLQKKGDYISDHYLLVKTKLYPVNHNTLIKSSSGANMVIITDGVEYDITFQVAKSALKMPEYFRYLGSSLELVDDAKHPWVLTEDKNGNAVYKISRSFVGYEQRVGDMIAFMDARYRLLNIDIEEMELEAIKSYYGKEESHDRKMKVYEEEVMYIRVHKKDWQWMESKNKIYSRRAAMNDDKRLFTQYPEWTDLNSQLRCGSFQVRFVETALMF